MRFLIAALALAGTETALAHTPDAGFLGNLGHQLTSMHHSPAVVLLGVLVFALVAAAIRNRATR
jgi:hypothetical protein